MFGLPNPIVARCRSTRWRNSSGSVLCGMTTVPPLKSTGSTVTPVPPARKNGTAAIVTSSLCTSMLDRHVDDVPGEIAVTQHDALGRARGPRRERQQAEVVESRRVRRSGRQRTRRSVVRSSPPLPSDESTTTVAAAAAGSLTSVSDPSTNTTRGSRIGTDGFDRVALQPVVDRRQHGAELRRREQALEKRRVVRAEPAHPIAPLHAERPQSVRQATHAPGEFCVGATRVTVNQSRPGLAATLARRSIHVPTPWMRPSSSRDRRHNDTASVADMTWLRRWPTRPVRE